MRDMYLKLIAQTGIFFAYTVSADSKCYYLDGQLAAGVYRCDNTTSGESSCCNAGQICYSNGVCQAGPQNHATDWLRVGCTDKTWSSPACLKQCTALVPESSCGIRPCGGILTSDQYCCDTQGKGPGSLACCSNSSDIFAIDPIPTIIATIPLNAPKSTSTSATAASTANSSISTSILTASSGVIPPITSASGSSAIPSNSYYFTSSNYTSSTSSPVSITKPAAVTVPSSLACKLSSLGFGVSCGFAMIGGLIYVL